jgi:hypothetical protein
MIDLKKILKDLLVYIDKKIEYEFASREEGADGYRRSCVDERKAMEEAERKLFER